MHNFMPMSPFMPRNNNQDFEARRSHFKNLLRQNMLALWRKQMVEIQNASDVKSQHQLPLVRIKKIMKSDEDVKMISADSPILFAKACEIFILELTLRAWLHTEENRRRTLQRCDVAMAIRNEELLDFLTDIVPLESHQGDMIAPSEVIDHQLANPMNLNNMNPAYIHGAPRNAPIPFVSTIDAVRPKYDPGFQIR